MKNPLKSVNETVNKIESISTDASNTMELTAVCLVACAAISMIALAVALMAIERTTNV